MKEPAQNLGIQARSVKADVMAVGAHATATKTVYRQPGVQELEPLLNDLRSALAHLGLQAPAQQALAEDVKALNETALDQKPKPDRVSAILSNFVGKLKMVGIAVGEVTAIAEPIAKIAKLFGIPFPC
jgi:hypothetical protein